MSKLSNVNFVLKKVKVHHDMSEETVCFSADLYQNGKLMAHVSNRGCGGCNDVHPAKGLTYKDIQHLTPTDVEADIMGMALDIDFAHKNQSKAFVLRKGENYYTLKTPHSFAKLKTMRNYADWLIKQLKSLEAKGYTVLNTNMNI